MPSAPKIALRDGSGYSTGLVFTTNASELVFSGTCDENTHAVQVAVNGGEWSGDIVQIRLQQFTVPDPNISPNGLTLDIGVNTVLVRAIDLIGRVSPSSSVVVTRLAPDVASAEIPTGIRVRRARDIVEVLIAKPAPIRNLVLDEDGEPVLVTTETSTFRGFNIYASKEPSGTSGYFRVNTAPVTSPLVYEEDENRSYDDLAAWDVSAAKFLKVRVSEEDEFGRETAVRLLSYHRNTVLSGKIRFAASFENYVLNEYVVFVHQRGGPGAINNDQFASVAASDPLYYVVTGVYYDPVTNVEIESAYSQEVLGAPLVLDTTIRDLPGRTSDQIVLSYIEQVVRTNPEISVLPGSVTKDVHIDPFASEAERIWFMLDYVHRSQSFLTLLAIDDVDGDGESDLVANSAYKQALKAAMGLQSDTAVQSLIDQQFDKLAANVGKFRLAGRQAVGTLTLYTRTRPTNDITIPAGSYAMSSADSATGATAQRFRLGGSYVLPAASAEAFYNYNERRYEMRVSVIAESAGRAGNVPAGAIKTLTGVGGVAVVNESSTIFGADRESNAELAQRAMLGFTAVDTGTEVGYASTAAARIGVLQRKVVKSGDALMMRDYDDVRRKHIGGKVDIWIQGVQERQVQDRFAFTYDIATNIRCRVVDSDSLKFTVLDSRVTESTPLVEILSVRNATSGLAYQLNTKPFIDHKTFQLDTVGQPTTYHDDIIIASYRFQALNRLYMTLQPVRHVVSVVGEKSGPLTAGVHYKLYKLDDPALEGESTIAKNYITITPSGGIPETTAIQVANESHVLVGFEQEPLGSIGINTATIHVTSADHLVTYQPAGSTASDYEIIAGTPTTPVKIMRTATSSIASGQEVHVTYAHDENFTVTYVVNDLLQQMQAIFDRSRHVTADVLVKQAILNNVDLETTVNLASGATKDRVDPLVRSNTSLAFNKRRIGVGVAQSNVDAAINDTAGVLSNVLPMARMAYADGSLKLREPMLSSWVRLPALDGVGGKLAYLLLNPLTYPTSNGGGLEVEHRGVFQDDVALQLSDSLDLVSFRANQAYIIGSAGALIEGYTDDGTLQAAGFLASQYASERLSRTANHVVVSLVGSGTPVDVPTAHRYTVSYVIRGDDGAHDFEVSATEAISLGNFTITWNEYREER